jgi:phosphatidylethanolamine/phosphatidyl-N-methylethanolamine N-methyltransferase
MTAAGTHKRIGRALSDEFRFIKGLIANPAATGAIRPSSPALARLMASYVDDQSGLPVLELGPGTGVVTEALIARGIPRELITTVEYSTEFCRLLRDKLPGVNIVRGDAYALDTTLPEGGKGPFAAVVSSLPLLTRPPIERTRLVEDALDRMERGRPLIQFSYSLFPPVPPVPGRFTVERSRWVLMNLPPARVWVYRRSG